MKNDNLQKWALVAEIIGGIAVIFSLIFVGLQVRQDSQETALNTRAINVGAYQDLISNVDHLNELRLLNGQIIDLMFKVDSGEILTEKERVQYRSFYRLNLSQGKLAFKQYVNGLVTEDEMLGLLGPIRTQLQLEIGKEWWPLEVRNFDPELANYIERMMSERFPEDEFWKDK